ncbi:cold-shock protein [Brucella anthropi]|uniref:Cold shock domain-containing protein n=2 Tax=Brucella anthropi TaxID=529 RepID=A0A6L3YZK1_BRUAN|nr:cold shock domain-containing protein [Brucella anthropi]KAB2761980.1 cold shock domain-containing protein [Brucella anthropi]UVV66696.1 cold shock domain-containing protein [Brucella anthropi]
MNMATGKVLLFHNGYGFIAAEPCNVFFHRSVIDGDTPKAGDTVRYDAVPSGMNSPKATSVRVIDPAVLAEAERVFGAS